MKKCKYCGTEYRFLHTCKGKREDPEKLRKLALLCSGILAVCFISIAMLFFYAGMDTARLMASYTVDKVVEIKATENLTFPLNETQLALAQSELGLNWAIVWPMVILTMILTCICIYLGIYFASGFVWAWMRKKTPSERLDALEAEKDALQERIKRLENWRSNGKHINRGDVHEILEERSAKKHR